MNETKRTTLFFDDWAILDRQGIERVYLQAKPWPGSEPWNDEFLAYSSVSSVIRDEETGTNRMRESGMTERSGGRRDAGL